MPSSRSGPAVDYVLAITCEPALEEIVLSRLFLTASSGSSSVEEGVKTTISAWFASSGERDAAVALFDDLDVTLETHDRERIDWLDRYEQSLEPIAIGSRFVVAPDARLIPEAGDRIGIVIPQEQAFGTGSHESTAMCLELMEPLALRGTRALDAGTGSGILAIGAILLGARKAIAFDNDPDTYAALRLNRVRNAIDPRSMPLFIGGAEALRPIDGDEGEEVPRFDLITMNILPDVILALLPRLVPRLRTGGSLIVSGVIVSRRNEVAAAASRYRLALADERSRGEWWAGRFER